MKQTMIALLCSISLLSCSADRNHHAAVAENNTSYRKCTGSSKCEACTSCRYCKHCAKEGGKCSVCK